MVILTSFLLIVGATFVEGRMLRQNIGIQQLPPNPPSSGLSPPVVPSPVGNGAPAPVTSPSPFLAYQATLNGGPVLMNWTPDPKAFAFDSSNIRLLRAEAMGNNYKVIMTAKPVYPVPTISLR